MRITVIDDEKYSRLELIHQIRQHLPQAEIFEASSGAQGIQLLEKDTFDILFIDIHLGDLEGTTVASLARRLMPLAKIIFATAYSEYAVTAFELRVDDYILKPFDPQRIRQALDQGFYRIHKTCLVHLKYIQDIFPWNNSSFALRVRGSSDSLPIGRDRVKELRRRLHI